MTRKDSVNDKLTAALQKRGMLFTAMKGTKRSQRRNKKVQQNIHLSVDEIRSLSYNQD